MNIHAFPAFLARPSEVKMATGNLGSPNVGRRADLAIFPWHLDARLLSVALERMTIAGLTLALVAAAAVVPRSAAKSPGTFAVGWRPPPSERRHSVRGSRPLRRF